MVTRRKKQSRAAFKLAVRGMRAVQAGSGDIVDTIHLAEYYEKVSGRSRQKAGRRIVEVASRRHKGKRQSR